MVSCNQMKLGQVYVGNTVAFVTSAAKNDTPFFRLYHNRGDGVTNVNHKITVGAELGTRYSGNSKSAEGRFAFQFSGRNYTTSCLLQQAFRATGMIVHYRRLLEWRSYFEVWIGCH